MSGELIVVHTGDNPLVDELFHNPAGVDHEYERFDGSIFEQRDSGGWHFGSGNPESWLYANQLLVPDGTVLDIGMGNICRSSFFFATQGMHVQGIDINPTTERTVDDIVSNLGEALNLDITLRVADVMQEQLGEGVFDIVLLDSVFNRFPSRAHALELIDKAYRAVKPGGHIWVRGVGKEDSGYEELCNLATWRHNVRAVDDDVILHPSGQPGQADLVPALFLDPTDLLHYFTLSGAHVVHSQVLSEVGQRNIMYGEDYLRDAPVETSGMVTILVQKPA
ncbi:MAG TPA: class I SAM-dependent methyltransferase [Verrucomicrobiae bacterium]|nr:class I SAM-dependent methyltransferase [Verrucomicrobiae bacterium]